jgi:hypothetical protein
MVYFVSHFSSYLFNRMDTVRQNHVQLFPKNDQELINNSRIIEKCLG